MHTLCSPLSNSDDPVYIAMTDPSQPWPGQHSGDWWLTYRLDVVEYEGTIPVIEVARLTRSRSTSMYGRNMADVCRFSFGQEFNGHLSGVWLFDGQAWVWFPVSNPKSVFDYTE